MREDSLYAGAELGHNGSHALAGLGKSGRVNVGLGGDAAHVETRASNLSALEDNNLEALLGGIFSGAVPTRARTDDNQIRRCH